MRRARWLVVASASVVLLAGASAAAAAADDLDIDPKPVPPELRDHPITPELHETQTPGTVQLARDQLTSLKQPDYGATARIGTQVRVDLNADADAVGTEITDKADALAPDDSASEEAMKRCLQNALWDMLFDAVWDAVHGRGFNPDHELGLTASRTATCIADKFGVGMLTADSVSDWMMESVIEHGSEAITQDPSLEAFVNWLGVTAWYSI